MAETQQSPGAFRLFRAFGISVSMHWTWLLLVYYAWQVRPNHYDAKLWAMAEFLAVFVLVLMHEFGHALACRSVGGQADRILLWPFGGIAFVRPPQRPGALLWSILAGPLVNVALVPVTLALALTIPPSLTDAHRFANVLFVVNLVLLVFNLAPIYPLDGGQILRALLWFLVGQARSLMVAAIIGLIGAGAVLLLALWTGSVWLVMLALLGALQSWSGFRYARIMISQTSSPLPGVVCCPSCGSAASSICVCACGYRFDSLVYGGICPNCRQADATVICPNCRQQTLVSRWRRPVEIGVLPPPPPTGPCVPPSAEGYAR